jgi:hypothetical protein
VQFTTKNSASAGVGSKPDKKEEKKYGFTLAHIVEWFYISFIVVPAGGRCILNAVNRFRRKT